MPGMKLDMNCPACSHKPLDYKTTVIELPYFGDTLQTSVTCPECGYRYTDIIITQQKEPLRYELNIDSEEDMSVRVVRSTSGTIRIPEFGILIEPGPMSESFVSNVEGVLERVKRILVQLMRDGDEENATACSALLERIENLKTGDDSATMIIDDPFGNSAILNEKATHRELTKDEVIELKTGMIVMDLHATEEE